MVQSKTVVFPLLALETQSYTKPYIWLRLAPVLHKAVNMINAHCANSVHNDIARITPVLHKAVNMINAYCANSVHNDIARINVLAP